MSSKSKAGRIVWVDLTVPNAGKIRDFYQQVVGWGSEPVSMGEYNDFNMWAPDSQESVAGICHTRGVNKEIPPNWMIYITVENMDNSVKACKKSGGKILIGPKAMGPDSKYCVMEDPAGAVVALIEQN